MKSSNAVIQSNSNQITFASSTVSWTCKKNEINSIELHSVLIFYKLLLTEQVTRIMLIELRNYVVSRLNMIIRVSVLLIRTVVDSDWNFDNLRGSHYWTQNKLHRYSASHSQHDLQNNSNKKPTHIFPRKEASASREPTYLYYVEFTWKANNTPLRLCGWYFS